MDNSENLTKVLQKREASGILLGKLTFLSGGVIHNLARIYYVGGGCDSHTKFQLEELNAAISTYLSITKD